ncbi:Protein of unknown function [Pyronema omphalodes CBS 100304]|uniref:Uncharacterized protein n=1 Tax=Pyronema omphalodes (strain CBS 100304) TaxID=1076935 RepID=U4LHT9_PYROM|nr:Protein of unknown function [Pyronema omphalodes CBS 100304]
MNLLKNVRLAVEFVPPPNKPFSKTFFLSQHHQLWGSRQAGAPFFRTSASAPEHHRHYRQRRNQKMQSPITPRRITAEDALRFTFEKLHRMHSEEYQSVILSMSLHPATPVAPRHPRDIDTRHLQEIFINDHDNQNTACPQLSFPAVPGFAVARHPRDVPTPEMKLILKAFSCKYPKIASDNNIMELMEVVEGFEREKERREKEVKERGKVGEWRYRVGEKIRGVIERVPDRRRGGPGGFGIERKVSLVSNQHHQQHQGRMQKIRGWVRERR